MKVVFLDRDGTINVDHGDVHRNQDWVFTEHAADAIRALRDAGFAIAVVTNQSAIAAGRYSLADVGKIHEFVQRQLEAAGTRIDAWAICPHGAAEDCPCRKPRTGMARAIESKLGAPIDYAESWTIGDKLSDIGFGQALGTRTALLVSRYWTTIDPQCQPTLLSESLHDAVREILRQGRLIRTSSPALPTCRET
ncbi:MAG: HAD family hydrolase [Vicinamibacterales bacterium]